MKSASESLSADALKAQLNPQQYKAVTTGEGPLFILAGAGSGKTRVITYRIAYLLQSGIPQKSILALTFTNKAAGEMAERVKQMTGKKLTGLTVSTFHAFGAGVIRDRGHLLGYRRPFSIYNQADQVALLKEAAAEIGYKAENWEYFEMTRVISAVKTGRAGWDGYGTAYKDMYREYHEHLKLYNAVDFDDLIIQPTRLFQENEEVLSEYRDRYRYILVDEFQDTSSAQYNLMHLLGEEHGNVCVVGDDDQSIYSWRGADYRNIERFEKDFPGLLEIKLEQNYRSCDTILDAANALIENNNERKGKRLWSGNTGGSPISISYPENEHEEAEFIVERIHELALRGRIKYDDIGILLRTNSLTAGIEEALLARNIPYQVSGGSSFFERKEIRDIIAYLKVMVNPDDEVNLLRIINTPRRGLGKRSLEIIRETAEKLGCSTYSACSALAHSESSPLPTKAQPEMEDFVELIEGYKNLFTVGRKLTETLEALVDRIDYRGFLVQEHQDNDRGVRWRYENILRFIEMLRKYETDPDAIEPSLEGFLQRISLVTRDEAPNVDGGRVHLMTIHAAKGLEFDAVFLAGVEDGIIPHARSLEENGGSDEEERRLFYVAITRAKQSLFITSCRSRKTMRMESEQLPSPFLEELPSHLVEKAEPPKELSGDEAAEIFARMKDRFR